MILGRVREGVLAVSRSLKKLQDDTVIEKITPRIATAMLIHGLLPEADAANFRPANLTVESIIKMLKTANEVRNRTVAIAHVHKLARDMTTPGHWYWTGAPIQIDHDGFVRNGQHRLLALILANVTLDFVVIRNIDPQAQLVIDTGRIRTPRDQLHMRGVRNASAATAIAKLLLRWRADKVMLSTFQPTVAELNDVIELEPTIQSACTIGARVRSYLKRAPISALGAVYVEASAIDVDQRDEFFTSLLTGAELVVNNPIYALRQTIIRSTTNNVRSRQAGQLYQVVHAWNVWRKNGNLQYIRVPTSLTSESFPKLV